MVFQSLRPSNALRDGPEIREYGSLILLLLASRLLGELVAAGIETVRDLMPDVLDPQLVGAVAYATLGLAALAAAYAAYLRRTEQSVPERHDLFTLAGATAMLLLFGAYLLHGAADLPAFPEDVVGPALGAGVTAGLALAYLRSRGIEVRIGAPGRGDLSVVGGTTLVSALAGVGLVVALEVGGNAVFRPALAGAFAPEPQLTLGELVWNVAVPGALAGVGMGILYNGAVQETLREREGPAGAAAAVATLVGVTAWGSWELARTADAVPTVASAAVVVVLAVVAAFLAARGTRLLQRTLGVEPTPAAAASASALVVALALVGVSAVRWYPPGIVSGGVGLAIVGAVAGVGYERSRSVWVPALGFAAYHIVVDPDLALHLARLLR